MSLRKSQTGFSVVELVIVVVVVAIVGLASYAVYNRQHNKVATTQPTSAVLTTVPSAPTISSASDLDKANATLSQVDPSGSNSSDSSQLDSQLATF